MSFLNPVNKPVLRFSSTDASAPQINYNSRVAGDVKAVLKACLVTGYGTTASAGWSVVNEVNHVAEFVSPSAAMSDYRLGIDDTSTSNTTWYYQYQDVRANPSDNSISKSFSSNNDKTSTNNGWQLLVTERGLFFVEILKVSGGDFTRARLTFFGATKLAIAVTNTKNIGFWCTGLGSPAIEPASFFRAMSTKAHFVAPNYAALDGKSINIDLIKNPGSNSKFFGRSVVDTTSNIHLTKDGYLIAEQVGFLLTDVNNESDLYGVYDTNLKNRPVLYMYLGREVTAAQAKDYGVSGMVYLDYWEY